jgi:hypothetical protein
MKKQKYVIRFYSKEEQKRRERAKKMFYATLKARTEHNKLKSTLKHVLHVAVSGDIN